MAIRDAQEKTAILRDLVQELIDFGALNLGQGYALVSKLDQIDRDLADREIEAAAELFQSFIDHVETFLNNGTISVTQAQPLVDAAQGAMDQLKA